MIRITISTAVAMILLMPVTAAGETTTARVVQGQWGVADKCNRTAHSKVSGPHPPRLLAKREQDVHRCLLANRVPSRAPLTPPQTSGN